MAFWVFVALVLALVALRRALHADRILEEQRLEIADLRKAVQALTQQLTERGGSGANGQSAAQAQPVDAAAAPWGADVDLARAGTMTTAAAADGPIVREGPIVAEGSAGPVPVPAAVSVGAPSAPPEATPVVDHPSLAATSAQTSGSPNVSATPPPPLPPSPTATGERPSLTPLPHRLPRDADDIESQLGGRWLLYIGIAALVLGASYFLKYAFDNAWIGEGTRVALGIVGGLALTALGQRIVSRGYALYGQVLCGGGLGIVYLAIFAAHRWYGILDPVPAFAAMVATTAAAAWLADRQRSQALALLAVTVGFLTPFLIGGEGSHITLFSYDAILVAGTLVLARRREWPALNLVSYAATVLTLAAWASRDYRPRLYLSVQFFLTLFLLLFLAMLREAQRIVRKTPGVTLLNTPTPESAFTALTTLVLMTAPAFYHFASWMNLRTHMGALLVYLIAFTVAGIIVSGQLRAAWLRVLVFAAIALPFMELAQQGFTRGWIAAAWVTTLAIYVGHAAAQIDVLGDDRERLRAPEILLLHGNGLWLLVCLQALIAPRAQVWSAPVAFALAVWYGVLAFAARNWHREAALHATALASALLAIACAIQFEGPWLVVALAAEGAVLVWLALRTARAWLRAWGGVLIVVAIVLMLAALSEPVPIGYWPLANPRSFACLFIIATLYALAIIHGREHAREHHEVEPNATDTTDTTGTTDTAPIAPPAGSPIGPAALIIAANILTIVLLSAEIDAYFDRRAWTGSVERVAGAETTAALSRQLTLSITWALYGVVLVAIGIRRRYRPVRYLAMMIFAVTILKVFFIDLATLDRVYKMLSVMGLGVLLLIASYLYQRLRAPLDTPETDPTRDPQPDTPEA